MVIDPKDTRGSIVVCGEDGVMEMVSPDAIREVGDAIDPEAEKEEAAEALRQRIAQDAADKFDNTPKYGVNDTFVMTGADGTQVSGVVQRTDDDGVEAAIGDRVALIPTERFEAAVQEVRDAYGNVAWRRTPEDTAEADVRENGESVPNTAESVQGTPGNVGEKGENVQQSMPDEQPHNNGRLDIQERPLLWERGAYTAPEDVATPTITTIGPPQGDEGTSRAKGQSNVSSVGKDTEESANRQTEDTADRKLAEQDVKTLLARMEADAEVSTEKELTAQTWSETFDEGNSIETPIGRVKMGDNQITKFFEKKRTKEFGMVAPTLKNPDVIIAEESAAKDGNTERDSSYLFVKTFNRNGEKIKFYASITVKKDGMEVSISSHYMNREAVQRKMQEGRVLYIREALLSNSSEWHLAEHRDGVPDLLPTQESNAFPDMPHNSGTERSVGKDTEQNSDMQGDGGNYEAVGRSLSESETETVISEMKSGAQPAPEMELNPENWLSQFGEDGVVATPIGEVRMGENQYFKLAQRGRDGKLGMVKPTLESPDVIVEDASKAKENDAEERPSSYVFVKTFTKADGSRYYHFTSVTVSKDGGEVVVSNQEKSENRISRLLRNGRIVWIDAAFSLHPTAQDGVSVPLGDSNRLTSTDSQSALLGVNSPEHSSVGKDTEQNPDMQGEGVENASALSRIPKDANGEPVYTAADSYTAWDALVEQCGGDADMAQGVADSMVKDMETALKKAEKSAPAHGVTVAEKIAAAKGHKAAVEKARTELEKWRAIAGEAAGQAPCRPSVDAVGMSGGIVSVAGGGGISAVNSTVNAKGSERADNDGMKVIVPRSVAELPDTDVYELVSSGRIGDAERLNSFDKFSRFDMYYCVRDDAMSPLFMRGDMLALANIPKGAVFPNGMPIVVDTHPFGFVFRRVYDAGDALECRVYDAGSGYTDTVMPKSQVIRLYRVVGLLRIGN